MNYPVWDVPASGLLIAVIAIVHVFVSHFAVGGGLFLVLTERRARRDGDADLLGWVRHHSRFFVLLTLVFGAITGVGIWFIIGLVHPAATSSLIQLFVWFWAIEWTFFITEIAAALVYYYGWDRLDPATHQRIGWVYFGAAWMSLFVINGILTFMLTPGGWLETGNIWSAFFNPTFWPALVARTAAAVGLAGLYALLTASWMTSGALKVRVARLAGLRWVVPMAVGLPLSLAWYVAAAAHAGVDVAAVFGAPGGSWGDVIRAIWVGSTSGHPIARVAALSVAGGGAALLGLLALGVLPRATRYGPLVVAPMMLAGLVTFGGAEFVREDLRKPFVLGQQMFVHGIRLADAPDGLGIAQVNAAGLLASAKFVVPRTAALAADDRVGRLSADGEAVSVLLCRSCHTTDGYLALRPLVANRTVGAIDTTLARLAVPVDAAGQPSRWDAPGVRTSTWRGRQMPPFAGTTEERRALAVYLALLGGATREAVDAELSTDQSPRHDAGAYFADNCGMCHADDSEYPFSKLPARTAAVFYEMLGRLPELNEAMPPFEGDDALRRALASHLSTVATGAPREVP